VQDNSPERQSIRLELLFCLFLLTLMIVFFIMCLGYQPAARRAPLVVMTPLTVMILSQLALLGRRYLATKHHGKNKEKSFYEQITTEKTVKGYLLLVWLIIFIVLIYLVGLVPGMAIFLIIFLRFVSRERWLLSLVLGLGVPAVLYLVFQVLLHILLYPGIIHRFIR